MINSSSPQALHSTADVYVEASIQVRFSSDLLSRSLFLELSGMSGVNLYYSFLHVNIDK